MRGRTALSIAVFLIITAYSIVRYHILKGVPWSNFPVFILNKSISLSAVVFIAFSYLIGVVVRANPKALQHWLKNRKFFGLLGFSFAAIHSIMSLAILNASYFPSKFDESGKLNLVGELSFLFGALSVFIFSIVAISSLPQFKDVLDEEKWKTIQRLGYLALFTTLLHVLVMGLNGWMKPQDWPGGLLPISLIAFSIILVTLVARALVVLFTRK